MAHNHSCTTCASVRQVLLKQVRAEAQQDIAMLQQATLARTHTHTHHNNTTSTTTCMHLTPLTCLLVDSPPGRVVNG